MRAQKSILFPVIERTVQTKPNTCWINVEKKMDTLLVVNLLGVHFALQTNIDFLRAHKTNKSVSYPERTVQYKYNFRNFGQTTPTGVILRGVAVQGVFFVHFTY